MSGTARRFALRPLLFAFVLVGVVAVLAVFILDERARKTMTGETTQAPEPAFPTLVESRGSVGQIEIGAAETGRVAVQLTRPADGGDWRLGSMADYPVAGNRVAAFLDVLAAAKLISPVDPAQVPETGTQGPTWRRVTLATRSGKILESFDLGPEMSTPKATDLVATHVRSGDGEAIWLADLIVERAIADPHAWIDTRLLAVPREAIVEVRTAPDQDTPLRIHRSPGDAGQFEITGLNAELRTDEAWKLAELTVPFTDMTFESAAYAESVPALFDDDWPGYMRTADGLVLRFAVARRDGKAWMRFRLDQMPPAIQDGDGQTAVPDPISADLDGAALRARLDRRIFQVPGHVADRLTRPRESIAVGDSEDADTGVGGDAADEDGGSPSE